MTHRFQILRPDWIITVNSDFEILHDTAVIVEDNQVSSRVQFGFVADARAPFAHAIDGSLTIDPLAVVDRVTNTVTDAPAPVLVSFTPETLTARLVDGGLAVVTLSSAGSGLQEIAADPWPDAAGHATATGRLAVLLRQAAAVP